MRRARIYLLLENSLGSSGNSVEKRRVAAGFSLREEKVACKKNMDIREKRHRLPKEIYKGEVSVTFTLCLKGNVQTFIKSLFKSIP